MFPIMLITLIFFKDGKFFFTVLLKGRLIIYVGAETLPLHVGTVISRYDSGIDTDSSY